MATSGKQQLDFKHAPSEGVRIYNALSKDKAKGTDKERI